MNLRSILFPVALLALAGHALASGSAPTRPPRPPAANPPAEAMDDARYALGKAVFNGQAATHENAAAAKQQRARLAALAAQAGPSGAALPTLAGRLSAEQMEALEYYVAKRFGAH